MQFSPFREQKFVIFLVLGPLREAQTFNSLIKLREKKYEPLGPESGGGGGGGISDP